MANQKFNVKANIARITAQARITVENEPTLSETIPADLEPAWRVVVYRLMSGDATAQTKVNELRGAELRRMGKRTA
jgi:hypothetical protein